MIPDWQTNKIYFSEKLKAKFPNVFSVLENLLNKNGGKPKLLPKTNDIWARDYMPIQISETTFLEYRYDPDYLQGNSQDKETRELKSYPDIICDAIKLKTKKSILILDGGNIVKSENAIILTEKAVQENKRHFTKKELINALHEEFEVEKVVLIPQDNKCVYGHSDGMLRFIDNETVLISGFYEQVDVEFRNHLISAIEKASLNYDWLRVAKNEKETNIPYINFLQTKDLLLVPFVKQEEDLIALEELSKFFPKYSEKNRIIPIEMPEITRQVGALNCISWTIKE